MHALRTAILVIWILFWAGWLISARWSKRGSGHRAAPFGLRIVVIGGILILLGHSHIGTIHVLALAIVGTAMFVAGLALAIWARVTLGRNWGMPMTLKEEPELVTSGPYRFVRHPIYTGILLAVLGSALATYVAAFVIFAVTAVYFVYSARIEDGLMATSFPSTYPAYRERTKMLIPFVL
jgi:protein-S-isoprenylcysteine O-methyltransferase Ste14